MTNSTTVKKQKLMPTCCVWIGRTGITTIFIGRLVCSFPSVQNGYLSIYLNKYMYMFIYLLYIYLLHLCPLYVYHILYIQVYYIYIYVYYIYISIAYIYLLYICLLFIFYIYISNIFICLCICLSINICIYIYMCVCVCVCFLNKCFLITFYLSLDSHLSGCIVVIIIAFAVVFLLL